MKLLKPGFALMLRTCDSKLRSYNGFQWPAKGLVRAPDWNPVPVCGNGLYGLLWGEGEGSLLHWSAEAIWLAVLIKESEAIHLHGKIKVPRGYVVKCGSREEITDFIANHGGAGKAICAYVATASHHGTATAGDEGTATAGHGGTATAGHGGTATAGRSGTATAGDYGTATAGRYGTATAGRSGTATAGRSGTATAGDYGTATVGCFGTATAGRGGTATAGHGGILQIKWHDGKRHRIAVGYVGEGEIFPDTPYVSIDGRFLKG